MNFKNYAKGLGDAGLRKLRAMEKVASEYSKVDFIATPPHPFLREMVKKSKRVQIFAQHVDPVPLGSYTGHIPPKVLKKIDVEGTLINHSEKRVDIQSIKKSIKLCKKKNLSICACAPNPKIAGKIAKEKPNYLAYEPPELIGTDISVSEAKPEVLSKSIQVIKEKGEDKVVPLCGAGIKKAKDVRKGLEMGAKGVLIASGIIKATDPYAKLRELVKPMVK